MDKNEIYDIEALAVPESAKETLRRTFRVASSSNQTIKAAVKSLFIKAQHGAGLSEYAKLYEKIIMNNNVYHIYGKETYLELAFPKNGSEKDYIAFFDSPRLVAAIVNSFCGVFLISFEQYSSYQELAKEPAFKTLLSYIDDNARNISFVFHVLNDFNDAQSLIDILNAHVNLSEVELKRPGMQWTLDYVEAELKKRNIFLTKVAKSKMEALIIEKIDFESSSYLGFSSIDRFIDNIVFEVACLCDEGSKGLRTIDTKVINELKNIVEFTLEENVNSHKVGFI